MSGMDMTGRGARSEDGRALRKGWTTGTCAAAAAKAAFSALITGAFPDPVEVTLPGGQRPAFALATNVLDADSGTVGIVKDAGDDPDVTHGALIVVRVQRGAAGAGVTFQAGEGVGTVTKPGLPIPPGEPAINPVPRKIISTALAEVAAAHGVPCDVVVEIGVAHGEKLAEKTLNGRLGIVGGLSILGTTGIVIPYSCAAWIHSIHRGIDVARATGITHIAASTGSTSENAVRDLYGLSDAALIDMGDFVGGTLKYVKTHPVAQVSIAGGLAKMTKLAQGMLDLHSKRGAVDLATLAKLAMEAGGPPALAKRIEGANTAAEAFEFTAAEKVPLGDHVAKRAQETALKVVAGKPVAVEVILFDRTGQLTGRAPFAHGGPPR
ncbi:MAG: cobalt-precorrin-5B (C(1))-methyltransferase [Pseudomonadota bacterium]